MNPTLKVSLCNRRTNSRYKNQEKLWTWLKDRNRVPVRTTETAAEYPKLPKAQRDEIKDHGGFVGGWLREGIRKNGNVLCRSVGALDADNIPADVDFPAVVRATLSGVEWFLYSTHKHIPEAPRFRLVILFDREVSEEEYPALMRQVAHDLGMDYFDDSTYEANRMMYWASCPADGIFVFEESGGCALSVDSYLSRYENWRDTTQWPTSSRESEVVRKSASRQEDPLEKPGVVGTFCRTYFPIQAALEKFLPDVYAPTDRDGRWDYIPAESTAGVVIYDERFVYSHHTTDPACGKLLNAFDIVRIHRFGDEDSKKSFSKMATFALDQPEVKLRMDQERMEIIARDYSANLPENPSDSREWTKQLLYRPKSSELEKNAWNLMLIMANDPDYRNFAFNEMAGRVEVIGEMPWARPEGNRYWRDGDTAALKVLTDIRYVAFPDRVFDACFTKTAEERKFHPVRDYLRSLPPWDGVSRIETLFHRCFQADDTPYVRAVTRKVFAAAVARILQPGIKFDCMLVLDGDQGIGKSTIFRELAGPEYFCETLSLTEMSDKTGAEKLQGAWIAEIGELAGMRKADIEKVKAFLSTVDDSYRPSYGRVVESHLRQCVIIATVNGERGYLRDITGNRRFWIVKCHQTVGEKRFSITPWERSQIWAEALHIWKNGEKLYLENDELRQSEMIQREAMEEDDRQGMVEDYLDMLLPASWASMDLFARRSYLHGFDDPTRPKGVTRRTTVSNVEIYAECFCNDPMNMRKQDSAEIMAILTRIGGWERSGKRVSLPLYGRQRICVRTEEKNNPDPPDPEDGILSLCPETETVSPNPASDAEESCQVQFSEEDVASRIQAPEPLYDFLR